MFALGCKSEYGRMKQCTSIEEIVEYTRINELEGNVNNERYRRYKMTNPRKYKRLQELNLLQLSTNIIQTRRYNKLIVISQATVYGTTATS